MRFPWKWAVGVGSVAALVVFIALSLYRPADPPPPDGLLQAGSCVVIESDGTAREVPCDDATGVVQSLVDEGESCPFGTTPYRDPHRGTTACVEPRGN